MSTAHRLSGHERRAAIVASAIKLFSEKGFRGATTRELAAAVGVSEPVLYQHFATKSELYAAIIDTKSNEIEQVVKEIASFHTVDDDAGFFRHLATLILHFYEVDPAYLRLLLFSSLERHELADLFHERNSHAFEQAVVRYIERRVQQGAFRPNNPHLIAASFMGMVANYGMSRMLNPAKLENLDRDQVIDSMVDIFMKGIQNETR